MAQSEAVPQKPTPERYTGVRVWAGSVTLSAFGPYVAGQVRTEQLAVLVSALLTVWAGARKSHRIRSGGAVPFVLLWVVLLAFIALATLSPPRDLGGYEQHPLLGGLAAFILPLALIILTSFWTQVAPRAVLLRVCSQVIVGAMALNAAIAIYQLYRSSAVVFSWLPTFWTADGNSVTASDLGSVAARAATNGRYSGIFNQPAEAGVAYGVAMFCLFYLVQTSAKRRSIVLVLIGAALVAGGFLCVSKIFVLGAFPLSLFIIARDRRRRGSFVIGSILLASICWYLSIEGYLPKWQLGSQLLLNLTDSNTQYLSTFSAGRYGNAGTLVGITGDLLRLSPWVGFGAGGVVAPYDSLWVEVIAVAGLLGLTTIVVVFAAMMQRWLQLKGVLDDQARRLAGATLILAFGGAFGVPTLTGTRVTTLLWLILGVAMLNVDSRSEPGGMANSYQSNTVVVAEPLNSITPSKVQTVSRARAHARSYGKHTSPQPSDDQAPETSDR